MTSDPSDVPRFARGFVLSDPPVPDPIPDWAAREVAGLRLTYAADVPVAGIRSGRHFVVVVGHFVDTETWRPHDEAIAAAVGALTRSEEQFLDVTDAWSGRYLVVFGTDTSRRVMTDASGMRSAFYSLDGRFVLASHARIVATATGAPRSPISDEYRNCVRALPSRVVMPMPGRSTPWSGVVFLTPNQVLDVETRVLRRAFPRRPLPTRTTSAAAALIAPRLQGQVSALVNTGRPVALSLTGGVDSRVSLAASRQVRDAITYFTYRRPGMAGTDADATTAGLIAKELQLRHRVLDVAAAADSSPLDAAIREATFLSHGRPIIAEYRRTFTPDTIHIRSNVSGVAKCFYRSKPLGAAVSESDSQIAPELLAQLWAHSTPSRPLIDAFEDWMDATGFRDVRGLDPLDVFYWEHRMACWHSSVVLESDFAFDTHVLFNSRSILELMLSAPARDRCRGALLRQVVSILWPELLRWPMGKRDPRSWAASVWRRRRA
jgi:Asparagine synthase